MKSIISDKQRKVKQKSNESDELDGFIVTDRGKELWQYAKQYKDAGKIVIPFPKLLKHSKTERWQDSQENSYGKRFWLASDGNIGWLLKEADLVLDIEGTKKGSKSWNDLTVKFKHLRKLKRNVETAGGGFHIYITIPEHWRGKRFVKKLDKLYPDVEFLTSTRSQTATIPPTKTKTGQYEWATQASGITEFIQHEVGDELDGLFELYQETKKANGKSDNVEWEKPTDDGVRYLLGLLDPDMHRDDWLQVAMAINSADIENGLDLFTEWSSEGSKYKVGECEKLWNGLKHDGKITFGLLIYKAKEAAKEQGKPFEYKGKRKGNGKADGEIAKLTTPMVRHILQEVGATPFIFNETPHIRGIELIRQAKSEMHGISDDKRRVQETPYGILTEVPFDKDAQNTMWNYLVNFHDNDMGKKPLSAQFVYRAIGDIADDWVETNKTPAMAYYHKYLTNNPKKVGKTVRELLENGFAYSFSTEGTPLDKLSLRLILCAILQRSIHPGWRFDYCTILTGAGGIGKTTLVENLLPPILRKQQFRTMAGVQFGLSGKDMIEQTSGRAIYINDECTIHRGHFNATLSDVKKHVSRTHDEGRGAYDKAGPGLPRTGIWIATANPVEDDGGFRFAGDRRFPIIELHDKENDYKASEAITEIVDNNADELWRGALEYLNDVGVEKALDYNRLVEVSNASERGIKLSGTNAKLVYAIKNVVWINDEYTMDEIKSNLLSAIDNGEISFYRDGKLPSNNQIGAAMQKCGANRHQRKNGGRFYRLPAGLGKI